jgi:putative DNA primase/helicase
MSNLAPHHVDLLKARAVTPDVAKARGYTTIIAPAELELAGYAAGQIRRLPVPGLFIPRYGLNGVATWPQYRPDAPAYRRDGSAVKYVAPSGSWNFVDALPDALGTLASDAEVWVSAEGPIKADAMTSAGALAVSMAGVWGWRSQGEPVRGLETLARWARWWHVVCDSDFTTTSDVPLAVCRLGAHLRGLGGKVRILHPPGDEKVGVDDWLAWGGTLDDLVQVSANQVAAVLRRRTSRPRAYSPAVAVEVA